MVAKTHLLERFGRAAAVPKEIRETLPGNHLARKTRRARSRPAHPLELFRNRSTALGGRPRGRPPSGP